MYGPGRLLRELQELGHEAKLLSGGGLEFGVIRRYEVMFGRFAGRVIDLALPAPPNFPLSVGSSIHVRATPQLLEYGDTVPGVRNIIQSPLGADWRYWSHNFGWVGERERSTARLLYQVNTIFDRV